MSVTCPVHDLHSGHVEAHRQSVNWQLHMLAFKSRVC